LLEGVMNDYMAKITGQATEAAMFPWQTAFGAAPRAPEVYAGEATKKGQQTQGVAQGCCFIFIEADNGMLDRIARRYREEWGTQYQKVGYKKIAAWLVPLMKHRPTIKQLVKWTMVRPLIWWGKAFYGENRWGHAFYPVAKGWLRLFEVVGRR
jgi:hypothetical protein